MILAYTLFNIFIVILSKQYFGKLLNPLSLYSIVWQLALTIHESGYIVYNELSVLTWIVIIFSQICFCFGFLSVKKRYIKPTKTIDTALYKKNIEKYLWICTIFSAISILSSLALVISIYGTNLIANVTNVYADRVNDNVDYQVIPYIGALIYVGLPLSAIHMKSYGFSMWPIIYFVLFFLNSLISGGRAGIVFSIFIFVFAFFYTNTEGKEKKIKNNKKKSNLPIIICVTLLISMFFLISSKRTAGVEIPYATSSFIKHFGYNGLIYKIFAYVANPVGVLNEFLKDPEFSFGHNTFLPFYNILAKIGLMERVEQYQSWYYVPAACNVGTWLRELFGDFSILMFPFIFIFGRVSCIIYWNAVKGRSTGYLLMLSIIFTMIGLSFFDWRMRTSSMWIALLFSYFWGEKIDKKSYLWYQS